MCAYRDPLQLMISLTRSPEGDYQAVTAVDGDRVETSADFATGAGCLLALWDRVRAHEREHAARRAHAMIDPRVRILSDDVP